MGRRDAAAGGGGGQGLHGARAVDDAVDDVGGEGGFSNASMQRWHYRPEKAKPTPDVGEVREIEQQASRCRVAVRVRQLEIDVAV
jgi:hypothetical protein